MDYSVDAVGAGVADVSFVACGRISGPVGRLGREPRPSIIGGVNVISNLESIVDWKSRSGLVHAGAFEPEEEDGRQRQATAAVGA